MASAAAVIVPRAGDLRPPRPAGMGRGAMLALLAHLGLLVALAFGVSWRSSQPAGVTAELWAVTAETAAPAAAEPTPAPAPPPPVAKVVAPPPPKEMPRDADIAIERAKAEQLKRAQQAEALKKEREREAKLKREEAAQQARAEKAEAERLAKQREDNLKRLMGQVGATGAPQATGAAQRDAGPSASYAGRIIARVRPNIVLTATVPPGLRAEVEVRAAPDGAIVGRRIVKASGNKDWDDAVLRAIDRTEVLPRDVDGRVPSPILIVFSPS
jgi:colicin import membrane protein